MQTLLLTAMSVAREREQGTFDQLLVTPFRPAEIMVGKALPSMLVGLVQATIVLLVAQLWFRIPFAGSFLTLYTGLLSVPAGGGRHRAAASRRSPRPCSRHALLLRADHAVHAAVGPDHADQQHAAQSADT